MNYNLNLITGRSAQSSYSRLNTRSWNRSRCWSGFAHRSTSGRSPTWTPRTREGCGRTSANGKPLSYFKHNLIIKTCECR